MSNPTTARASLVYFIHAIGTNRVKIGHSFCPSERMAELKVGSPFPLRIIHQTKGARPEEKAIQRQFEHQHAHGEWYEMAPHQIAALEAGKIPLPSRSDFKSMLPALNQGYWWNAPVGRSLQQIKLRWREHGKSKSFVASPLKPCHMDALYSTDVEEQRWLLSDWILGAIAAAFAEGREVPASAAMAGMCRAQRAHR